MKNTRLPKAILFGLLAFVVAYMTMLMMAVLANFVGFYPMEDFLAGLALPVALFFGVAYGLVSYSA